MNVFKIKVQILYTFITIILSKKIKVSFDKIEIRLISKNKEYLLNLLF